MDVQAEFSRIVNLDDLSGDRAVFDLSATEEERRALADRFGIEAIESLSAKVRLDRSGRDTVVLTGQLEAVVVQTCVVTLEPVRNDIREPLDLRFRRVPAGADAPTEVVISPEEDFEPLEGSELDIGEVVAEELALSLDPFPRAPDADSALEVGANGTNRPDSPFGALAAIRRKD